jgi:hypothetical protein
LSVSYATFNPSTARSHMSTNDKQNENKKNTPTQVEENQQNKQHEVKETELSIESLEERIAPARIV